MGFLNFWRWSRLLLSGTRGLQCLLVHLGDQRVEAGKSSLAGLLFVAIFAQELPPQINPIFRFCSPPSRSRAGTEFKAWTRLA